MDESFRKFIRCFDDLAKAKHSVNQETTKLSICEPDSADPSYLYREQLEAALKKQNMSMDDYLNVSSCVSTKIIVKCVIKMTVFFKARLVVPTTEPSAAESIKDTKGGFFSDIDLSKYGLDDEELHEATERAERKFSKFFNDSSLDILENLKRNIIGPP